MAAGDAEVVAEVTDAAPVSRPLRRFVLQWHLTDRCNLRCVHCYRESDREEMAWRDWMAVLDQATDFARQRRGRVQFHLTGGEPFLCERLFDLIDAIRTRGHRFAIMSNGSLIDAAAAARLKRLHPLFVQVSIDGTEKTHDSIRGPGSFHLAVQGLKELVRQGIATSISFTAHRQNYLEFTQVARLGRRLRVKQVWADRLIPAGQAKALNSQMLSVEQTREFFEIMETARRACRRLWVGRSCVSAHRALQFLAVGGRPYRCTAGDTLLALMPNGDLLPCRRLPILVGNILQTSLSQLYDHPTLGGLRESHYEPEGCHGCTYVRACRGGLRCLTYALHDDPRRTDPGCWRAR